LGINAVARSKLVLTYFASKASDEESQDKIIKLNDLIQQQQKLLKESGKQGNSG